MESQHLQGFNLEKIRGSHRLTPWKVGHDFTVSREKSWGNRKKVVEKPWRPVYGLSWKP